MKESLVAAEVNFISEGTPSFACITVWTLMPPFFFPKTLLSVALAAMALPLTAHAATPAVDPLTQPIASPYAAQWNRPQQPARIHGDTYYVGVGGLSVELIDTREG